MISITDLPSRRIVTNTNSWDMPKELVFKNQTNKKIKYLNI